MKIREYKNLKRAALRVLNEDQESVPLFKAASKPNLNIVYQNPNTRYNSQTQRQPEKSAPKIYSKSQIQALNMSSQDEDDFLDDILNSK